MVHALRGDEAEGARLLDEHASDLPPLVRLEVRELLGRDEAREDQEFLLERAPEDRREAMRTRVPLLARVAARKGPDLLGGWL